eukprot:TRINITY_DN36203_c0_g1_i1.p1 TRINITY_DN36203_c0_g1~~TRINITY_DN36203_c0_g1_i1.p1  ORF type:complete len:258 (+),score=76.73 TRINITY_DN36203_c0_g1_i1:81-776(+)
MPTAGGTALIAFARLPVPGKVKTRLAKGVGPEGAAQFYKLCAERVLSEAALGGVDVVYVFFSVAEEEAGVAEWMKGIGLTDVQLRAQCKSPNLGDRMRDAFAQVFEDGAAKAVIIGTDIPDIDRGVISKALAGLGTSELVIGPAADGGYYLLGMTQPHPELFSGVEWSTDSVLSSTLEIAAGLGLRVAERATLPVLRDMDHRSDLQEWHDGADGSHPLKGPAAKLLAETAQ